MPEGDKVKEAFDIGEALRAQLLSAEGLPDGVLEGIIMAYQQAVMAAKEDPMYAGILALAEGESAALLHAEVGANPDIAVAPVQSSALVQPDAAESTPSIDIKEGGPVYILAMLYSRLAEVAMACENAPMAMDLLWKVVELICRSSHGMEISKAVKKLYIDALKNIGNILYQCNQLEAAREFFAAIGVVEGNQNGDTILQLATVIRFIKLRDAEGSEDLIDIESAGVLPGTSQFDVLEVERRYDKYKRCTGDDRAKVLAGVFRYNRN